MVEQKHTVLVDLRARDQIATVLRRLGPEGQRAARELERAGGRMSRTFRSIQRAGSRLSRTLFSGFQRFGRLLRSSVIPQLLAVGAAFAGISAVKGATEGFLEFENVLAEVGTVADLTAEELAGLEQTVLDLAKAQGENEAIVGRGLYQTISAGFGEAADAAEVLSVATELATAGLSDTESAVGLLTSALNAYGKGADEAQHFSDLLFQTVKLGVTTIPRLSASLSQATSTAASLGVSFDELLAAVAAMTKAGSTTSKALNDIRGAMEALLRNGKEVDELFRLRLGRSFDENTIKTEGLATTLNLLVEASRGSTAKLQELLGSSEALSAVLKLTGVNADTFQETIEGMEDAAGATDRALVKMQATLGFGLKAALNAVRQGFEQALGRTVSEALSEITDRAGGLESVLGQVEIISEALGETVAIVVRRFGDLLGTFSKFIERAGGAPAVLKIVGAGIKVVGVQSELVFETMTEGAQRLIDTLTILPLKVKATAFGLSELRSRALNFQGLDAELGDIVGTIGQMRAELAALPEDTLAPLGDVGAMFAGMSTASEFELQRIAEINRDLPGLIEERDRILEELRDRTETSDLIDEIEGRLQGERGDAFTSPETRARLEESLAELGELMKPAAAGAGDEIGLAMIASFGATLAANAGFQFSEALTEAIREAAANVEGALDGLGGSQDGAAAEIAQQQLAEFTRLDGLISEDLVPTYEELQEQIKLTLDLRAKEIESLREAGDLTAEQAQVLSELAERAARDQRSLIETTASLSQFTQAAQQVGRSVSENLGRSLQGLVEGTVTAREAFQRFADQVISDLIRITIQKGILDNLFGAGAGGTATGSGLIGGLFGFARGGVTTDPQGYQSVRGYASGGFIAREPHIALVGEGTQAEAVVPLPDGRSIPVTMQGGGGGTTVNIQLSAVDGPSMDNYLRNGEGVRSITAAVKQGLAGADRGLIDLTRRVSGG